MDRRGFLSSILALAAAPAIVRAESIMRVRPIITPGDAEFGMLQRQVTLAEAEAMFPPPQRTLTTIVYGPGGTVLRKLQIPVVAVGNTFRQTADASFTVERGEVITGMAYDVGELMGLRELAAVRPIPQFERFLEHGPLVLHAGDSFTFDGHGDEPLITLT